MKENYFLIGTAGHVDHGKTQLIQALTGISTDRLKEEKERGISIELGFAYLNLPDGRKAGIVDVPGHERFIRQMLAGASGMDVVLLVVAADEGFMPQTQEHLDILNLLKLEQGIIVITKIDLVDPEWLAMVEQDIKEKLIGSFLEDAPCCKVSSVTGEGIDDLTQTIFQVLDKAEHRRTDLAARMPIDRVFTIQGFGTVVTGTLNSGSFQKGQDVAIEPGGRLAKIRSIQVHGDSVTKVLAGQRAAINLSGLAVDDVEKGSNLVEPHHFQTGQIVDIELYNLAGEKRAIKQRQRIHFHLGTAEVVGRIHLLNQEELLPGKTCYAQVILESPVLAVPGDRFVIRYYSPVTTIGGGTVLGITNIKRKRFREIAIEELRVKAEGSIPEQIKKELVNPVTLKELEKSTNMGTDDLIEVLDHLERTGEVIVLAEEATSIYWVRDAAEKWAARASETVRQYQKNYPLKGGIGREELKKKLETNMALKRWQTVLDWGAQHSYYRVSGNMIEALPEIKLPEEIERRVNCLIARWEQAGINPPEVKEAIIHCRIPEDKFEEYAAYLTKKGHWIRVGDYFFALAALEKAKDTLKQLLLEKGQASVAEARDLWQTSRKYAVPILEYFDSIKFTRREDLVRKLF